MAETVNPIPDFDFDQAEVERSSDDNINVLPFGLGAAVEYMPSYFPSASNPATDITTVVAGRVYHDGTDPSPTED